MNINLEIGKGMLHREAGRLTLPITCNFVMPFADCEKVKAVILHKLDVLKEVELDFSYRDFVMSAEEAARLYVPHMVQILNGSYLAITKAIVRKPRRRQRRTSFCSGARQGRGGTAQ